MTTKIHLLTDALGRPLRYILTGGEAHESRSAEALLDGVACDAVVADKGYDSNAIRETIATAGMTAVIPSSRARKTIIPHDKTLYRERNLIGVFDADDARVKAAWTVPAPGRLAAGDWRLAGLTTLARVKSLKPAPLTPS